MGKLSVLIAGAAFFMPQLAGAQEMQLRPEPNLDGIYSETRAVIQSTGRSCPDVEELFQVYQGGSRQGVFKARCSNSLHYQVTVMSGKIYVKEWSGSVFGVKVE